MNKKPVRMHMIQGTGRRSRLEKRAPELELPSELPDPPEWLSLEARAKWNRITGEPMCAAALSKVDRAWLAIYCCLWADFVAGERPGETPMKPAMLRVLTTMGSKLGLSPVDRAHIPAPPPHRPPNKFGAIG